VRRYRLHEEHEKVFLEDQSVCAARFNPQINALWAKESVIQLLDGVGGHDQDAAFLRG
jgi:hypothetical protein